MPFGTHTFLNTPYNTPTDTSQHSEITVGMGCFWGAERLFWNLPKDIIYTTSVGYSGGDVGIEPNYKSVCSGRTGYAEVVKVVYKNGEEGDSNKRHENLNVILQKFWENHDPTQGNRQGNDHGTQYRSVIYTESQEDLEIAQKSKELYQNSLSDKGINKGITTEIKMAGKYFLAEDYHQQYLHKDPNGYCGLKGSGVSCPYVPKK